MQHKNIFNTFFFLFLENALAMSLHYWVFLYEPTISLISLPEYMGLF